MPTSSYLTTRNSSYLSSSPDTTFRKTSFVPRTSFGSSIGGGDIGYRRSSLLSTSFRHYGDDSSASSGIASSSRFGVSSTRTTSSSASIPSSSLTRTSIDRDSRKPPLGLTSASTRLRSESRLRDLSLDNGYTVSTKYSSSCNDTSSTLKNLNRLSTSSLARSVATSGADLYAKYSPSNYKSNCELSRSRSLTDSTVDSISANSSHLNGSSSRAASRDRSSSITSSAATSRTNGSLLAGNSANAKDYSINRSSSPISTSASIKVKPCAKLSVLPTSLSHSRCSYSNATSASSINNNNQNTTTTNGNGKFNLKKTSTSNNNTINNNHNNNNNNPINNINNNNALSDSIVVSGALTSSNNKKPSSDAASGATNRFPVKKLPISATSSALNTSRPISAKINNRPPYGPPATSNSTVKCSVASSESFKKRLGTNPLSPYKNPDFLKCEYDLARSQVVNSRSKSANSENNNNNNNIISTVARTSPSATNDSNSKKITSSGANESPQTIGDASTATIADSENNMNCVEYNNVDLLDDIKFIDSDDSDRKHSPGAMKVSTKEFFSDASSLSKNSATATLPSNSSAKKINDMHQNKYNTISNGNGPHQIQIQIGNDIGVVAARKAIAEDMVSSTSSSTSTLSAMTESSTSSFQPNNLSSKETPSPTTKPSKSDGNATDNVSVITQFIALFLLFCLPHFHLI